MTHTEAVGIHVLLAQLAFRSVGSDPQRAARPEQRPAGDERERVPFPAVEKLGGERLDVCVSGLPGPAIIQTVVETSVNKLK
jgi:hypothetical protein